ncbi:MAG: TolC family protein [Treponema sp.]|nr:TolC family protein [Treponema sp.]
MKKILFATFLVLSAGFIFAQEKTGDAQSSALSLSVEDAVKLALESDLSIKQSKMDLEVLSLKEKYSWNNVAPTFGLSTGINTGLSSTLIESKDSKDAKKAQAALTGKEVADDPVSGSFGWNIGASVGLNLSPSVATTMKAAQLALEKGEMSLDTAKHSIELSVRNSFYSLLYFNDSIELQQRGLETAKQTYESNVKKYNQGRLSELELLTSQYNYEKQIPTVENLKQSFEDRLNDFKYSLGIPFEQEIELQGNLDEALQNVQLDDTVLNYTVEDIPSIKTQKLAIETMENSLKATKYSVYSPSVRFSLSDSISQNTRKTDVTKKETKTKGNVGNSLSFSTSVSIPLDGYLPWSSGKINIAEQISNIEKQKQNLEKSKTQIAITARKNYNAILQAKEQLSLYEKNVALMQKTYEMTRKAYEVGSSDFSALQNAENNLMSAKYNVTNQKYQIISGILALEDSLGLPFGTLNQLANKVE